MSRWMLCLALLTLLQPGAATAAPRQQLSLAVPLDGGAFFEGQAPAPSTRYQPAPLPNRSLAAPQFARGPAGPSLAPTLFTSQRQFRGDGFSPGSTAQGEQERNMRPSPGFLLHMPLEPQPK